MPEPFRIELSVGIEKFNDDFGGYCLFVNLGDPIIETNEDGVITYTGLSRSLLWGYMPEDCHHIPAKRFKTYDEAREFAHRITRKPLHISADAPTTVNDDSVTFPDEDVYFMLNSKP